MNHEEDREETIFELRGALAMVGDTFPAIQVNVEHMRQVFEALDAARAALATAEKGRAMREQTIADVRAELGRRIATLTAERDAAVHGRIAERAAHKEQLDELVVLLTAAHPSCGECEEPECSICAVRDCPHHEWLHHHHDGCPACFIEEKERATSGASKETTR